jgi:hypothetical protein
MSGKRDHQFFAGVPVYRSRSRHRLVHAVLRPPPDMRVGDEVLSKIDEQAHALHRGAPLAAAAVGWLVSGLSLQALARPAIE